MRCVKKCVQRIDVGSRNPLRLGSEIFAEQIAIEISAQLKKQRVKTFLRPLPGLDSEDVPKMLGAFGADTVQIGRTNNSTVEKITSKNQTTEQSVKNLLIEKPV